MYPRHIFESCHHSARGVLTEVTLRSVFRTREQRDRVVEKYHAIAGTEQTLGRLASYLTAQPMSPERKDST